MTALSALVPSIKRAVAVPGTFDNFFPDTLDTDLAGLAADAFAEAQLDQFVKGKKLDMTDPDATLWTVTPDLTMAEYGVITLYASIRMLTAEILNRKSRKHYKAGVVEFEEEQGASILSEQLRVMAARRQELILLGRRIAYQGMTSMTDQYMSRGVNSNYAFTLIGLYPEAPSHDMAFNPLW
jgi:hypothetical protein